MPSSPSSLKRRRLLSGSIATALLSIGGCGSGDSIAGVGGGGTGSFATGPIRGFGSIIVSGVRYDDSAARIVGDDGTAAGTADLRLGMVVEVTGSDVTNDPVSGRRRANASSINLRSEIEGPVSAIDAAAGTLTVLGQVVRVSATTVFDDDLRGGLASLAVGQIVEVYGLSTSDGIYTATRLEREDDPQRRYKLRGRIAGHDAAARRFQIGTTVIDYRDLASAPALADGQFARVELARTPGSDGSWLATRIVATATASTVAPASGAKVELEGYITAMTDARRFTVHGLLVDASNVSRFPGGLAVGSRVEVEGRLANGVVVAQEVELEDDDDDRDDGFEIEGRITAVDTATLSFTLRGVVVDYSQARFDDGTAADLKPGAKVEVKGRLAPDGTRIIANEVEFDD